MTITRREWLRRAALLASGAVAADQLDLLDRLGWTRTMFPSAAVPLPSVHALRVVMTVHDGIIRSERVTTYVSGPVYHVGTPNKVVRIYP